MGLELQASSTPAHLAMPPPGPPLRCDRTHDIKKALTCIMSLMKVATYHAMVKTYRMYDYPLIELSCISVEERVDFILSRIFNF